MRGPSFGGNDVSPRLTPSYLTGTVSVFLVVGVMRTNASDRIALTGASSSRTPHQKDGSGGMAYKRRERGKNEGYRIQPVLPRPFGRVGPWQTGTHSRANAEKIEAYIKECAVFRPAVINGLLRGDFNLRELWIAKTESDEFNDRIGDLLRNASDPLLAEAAQIYGRIANDSRVKDALPQLAGLADRVECRRAEAAHRPPPRESYVRLSWLLKAKNVTELYAAALEMRTGSSVRRSIHRAVTELLQHHFGKARVRNLMLDVRKPPADDHREVHVTPAELRSLLSYLDPDFRDFVTLAILLAVDRGPLTRIRPRFYDREAGTLEVLDTKSSHRRRKLLLSAPAAAILDRLTKGRSPDELVFTWTDGQIRYTWERARDRAAREGTCSQRECETDTKLAKGNEARIVTLPKLRFKDLRHVLPTVWENLKLPRAELQMVLGHAKGSKMTDRYITTVGDRAHMDAVADFLAISRNRVD